MSLTVLDKKLDILYYDAEENIVKIRANCNEFPEVKVLFRRDKSLGKKFFQKCITYCYYMNHKNSPISHKPYSLKKKSLRVYADGLLNDFDDENKYYKAFEAWFKENHLTKLEIRYFKLMNDIDTLIEKLSDLPMYVKQQIEVEIPTTECSNGEEIAVTKRVKTRIEIDNSKAKKEAIMNIKSLEDLRDFLEKKIKVEDMRRKTTNRRMFDV